MRGTRNSVENATKARGHLPGTAVRTTAACHSRGGCANSDNNVPFVPAGPLPGAYYWRRAGIFGDTSSTAFLHFLHHLPTNRYTSADMVALNTARLERATVWCH